MSGDIPNYCNIEIGQNTEKSFGDLRRRCYSKFCERPTTNADLRNSQRVNDYNNNNYNNIFNNNI